MANRKHRSVIVGALLLLSATALLLLLRPRESQRRPSEPTAAVDVREANASSPLVTKVAAPEPKMPAPDPPSPAPIIDEITVDSDEVCEGAENLVRVRAHAADGQDEFLRYGLVGGEGGPEMPVRVFLDEGGRPVYPSVVVSGRGGASTTQQVPHFRVKRCAAQPVLRLGVRPLPNQRDVFEFSARLQAAEGAAPLTLTAFSWSFGGGSGETTSVPYVTHSFEQRAQTRAFDSVLVAVVATADNGTKISARLPLTLRNRAFEAMAERHVVLLSTQPVPAFAELLSDGSVRQGMHIWHTLATPVPVSQVLVQSYDASGKATTEKRSALDVLGVSSIPPGDGIHVELTLPASQKSVQFVNYTIAGTTTDSLQVAGSFSVVRPTPLPTADSNIPVEDPLLAAKIKKARELLNKPFVTDRDLQHLEAAGQFAALDVPAQQREPGAAAARPSYLPK